MTKEGERFVWGSAKTAVLEVGWNAFHLRRSFEQRSSTDLVKAARWLDLFYEALQDGSNGFSIDGEAPTLGQRIAAGFWFTVYSFQTPRETCVLKISHLHAPWYGQFSPASEEFFQEYKKNLAKQKSTYSPRLPHLILPQEVRYAHNGRRGATLIAQPYIPHKRRITDFRALDFHNQERIINEYDTFITLTRELREEGLQPDLILDRIVRNHNLVIAQMPDGPHLVLLDNGVIDLTRRAPVLNRLAPFTADLTGERARLQRIYNERNGNQR